MPIPAGETDQELEERVRQLVESCVRINAKKVKDIPLGDQTYELKRIQVVLHVGDYFCELSEEREGGSFDAKRKLIVELLTQLVMNGIDLHDCASRLSSRVLET